MKEHYRKFKGWKRGNRRPVYRVRMTEAEVRGRRTVISIYSALAAFYAGVILWVLIMI